MRRKNKLSLTPNEAEILTLLRKGYMSKKAMVKHTGRTDNSIRLSVCSMRKKLQLCRIITYQHFGYELEMINA